MAIVESQSSRNMSRRCYGIIAFLAMVSADVSQAFTGPMHGSLGEYNSFSSDGTMSRFGSHKDRRDLKLLKPQRPTCIMPSDSETCNSLSQASVPPLRVTSDSPSVSVVSDGYGFSWIPVGGSKEDSRQKTEVPLHYTNSMGFSSIPVGAPRSSS